MRETVPTFSRIEPRQARSTVCNSRQSRSTAVDGVSLNATACEIRYQQLICHAVLHSHAPSILATSNSVSGPGQRLTAVAIASHK